jgi:hypothetical protein
VILLGTLLEARSYIWPLGCGNKGARVNRVHDSGDSGRGCGCARELRESGGWVVGVTVWILDVVEGRTLVFVQRDAVLNAQW